MINEERKEERLMVEMSSVFQLDCPRQDQCANMIDAQVRIN